MPSRKLRVCLAATSFPRWPGDGQGAFIWGLTRALAQRGIEVEVTTLHAPESASCEMIEAIPVYRPIYWWPVQAERLKQDTGGLPITLRRYPLARIQLPWFTLVHAASIARLSRTADLIHAHWTLSGGAALLARLHIRRPLVITVQGSDIFQVPKLPGGAWLTRSILTRAQRVTALSGALCDAAVDVGVPRSHIQIIPNGVDTTYFAPPNPDTRADTLSGNTTIVFVGSLIKRKGLTYLLAALPPLVEQRPNLKLIVLGDGPEAGALQQQVSQLQISRHVDFAGFRPQADIRAWMQRAHLFVLPSLEEGQGVVLLEALACGLPIVASDVDGIRDVVVPAVGKLVPSQAPEALGIAIQTLLSAPVRWHEMSLAARRRAEAHYSWLRIADLYIDLYRELIDRS